MGLSAKYKRHPIRTRSAWWAKINGKLQYCPVSIYTSTSGKGSYKFCWEFKQYGNQTKNR